jgi:hypothetical protein
MKAVGAANWQLQALYVIEGSLIGLIGGLPGLVLAWLISFPGDAWGPLDGPTRHEDRPDGLDLRLPGVDRRDSPHVHHRSDDRRGALSLPARCEA